MATIKSYTDLEQSKKLAEILPIESADMHYNDWTYDFYDGYEHTDKYVADLGTPKTICGEPDIPCWSLAALLNVIPYTIYKSDNEFYRLGIDKGYDDYAVWYNNNGFTITDLDVASDNFVDACVAMIIKLHELKML